MTLQVVSTDLRTGRVIADLPNVDIDWPLRRTIGKADTGTAHLYLSANPPENWPRAVMEGAAVLHLYDDEDPGKTPQWSGYVVTSDTDLGSDKVDLALATLEGYTDRRYVGDKTYDDEPQNDIVIDLLESYIIDGGTDATAGLPLEVRVINTPGVSTRRSRTYKDSENAKVYARLGQLMALDGGPEWIIEHEWTADHSHIIPVLYVGNRIGRPAVPGLEPGTSWQLPGALTSARILRDYSDGKGANLVTATSSGQGDLTPTSGPIRAASLQGRPLFEYRWSPSSSIKDPATLVDYALGALRLLSPGAVAVTLTADRAAAPMPGRDWQLGDDIGYQLGGPDPSTGADLLRALPGGLSGRGRVIAAEFTRTSVTPIMAQDELYAEET